MRPALPATVVITQARHPLEGRDLRVLGWMRRLGRLELMLELPDGGTKRLILAEHTSQHDDPDPGPGTGTLGRTADLLALSVLVSALCTRSRDDREQAAQKPPAKEDDRAAWAAVSLLPDQVPAPPAGTVGQLPAPQVETAITLLAGLIAKAARMAARERAGDE